MEPRTTLLRVLAWMAQADGEVVASERALLVAIAGDASAADEALEAVRGESLEGLAPKVDRYADRFFIAMRARSCALADGRLDPTEAQAFARLVDGFKLLPEDVTKIEEVASATMRGEDTPPDDRVRALFVTSSFTEGDGSFPEGDGSFPGGDGSFPGGDAAEDRSC